jgi:molybdenum cofactor guanylyltransferase
VGGPLLVVRGRGQRLPKIPAHVKVVDDPEPGLGPLRGIAAGLGRAGWSSLCSVICSTELPFLYRAFVRRVLTAPTDDFDVVLPVAGGYPQPLAAAYRITRGPVVDELLAATAMVATRPAPFARCHLVRCRRGGGAGVGQLADCHDQRRNGRLDGDIPLVTGATVAFRCPDAGG